jgi:integrase
MTHATLAPFESRAANLLEPLFLEKRRTRIIPHVLRASRAHVISAAIRTADRWLGIQVGDFGTAIRFPQDDRSSTATPGASPSRFPACAGLDQLDDWHFHDCRHHVASWFMMRGGNLWALSKILGHAKVSMTEKYAHLAPDHLRAEISRTERAVGPVVGTTSTSGDEHAPQMVDFTAWRRGSSEAEQLIRNQ